MEVYRYCVQCGASMNYQEWCCNYCQLCGTRISKYGGVQPTREPGRVGVPTKLPASAVRQLQAVGEAFKSHSALCSVGAIGVGAAGVVLAPLVLAAGQGIMILGVVVAGVSGYAGSTNDDLGAGVKLGVGLLGAGAVVYGSSYVLMVAGGMSVAAGIGGGVYSGVKAISKAVKSKNRTVNGRLLLMEGRSSQ